jgi:hypothetical protein
MSKSIRIPSLAKIAARLESMMDAARPFRDADDVLDVRLALGSLLLSCHDCLDSLAAIGGKASLEDMADAAAADRMDRAMRDHLQRVAALTLPPIAGGAPDDFEEMSPEFEADPAGWPAWTDAYRWEPTFDGPTPLDVLEADEFEPERTDADWDAYAALSLGLSEADHYAAHACV